MTTPDDNLADRTGADAAERYLDDLPPHDAGTEVPIDLTSLKRRSWMMVGVSFLVLIGIVSVIGLFVRPDYVAIVPGQTRETEPLLEISGTDIYEADGELLYVTIRLRQDMDLWTYLWTRAQGDNELIDSSVYFGDQSPEENLEANLERMTSSKDTAIAVALDALGYDMIDDAGVIVAQVVEDSPAVGKLEPGDVFTSIDGTPVTSHVQLVDLLADYAPGDTVSFSVTRAADQTTAEVEVTLGENPERPGVGFIGIAPATLADINEPPFEVDIESESVGGPSAGLAFTLGMIDSLTPGELSGGARVAVTGTIGIDGSVGAIGGIEQKAVAVRDSGATAFIVPAGQSDEELAEVARRLGDGVELIPVSNLDEALEALRSLGGDIDAVDEFEIAQS